MLSLHTFHNFLSGLKSQRELAPLLFIGHGSPMNGIELNMFSKNWELIGKNVEQPQAVLVISAHWLTQGTHITAMAQPPTIHDFGGFPRELYEVQYPAKGDPVLAEEIKSLITRTNAGLNHDWGLDHGAWSVMRHIFPEADMPVLQLSIDYDRPASYHYALAKELSLLRKKGVMIIGSGNMIHNLRMVDWRHLGEEDYGYDWAKEINAVLKEKIERHDHSSLINYQQLSKAASLAIPTPDHYFPLIYALALQSDKESPVFFNDQLVGGSLNMTSVLFA